MNLMTESKVIQEADEAEEFQQNPDYYHRNIDPAQVNFQINFISRDVSAFIHKLRNSHPRPYPSSKPERNSQLSLIDKSKHYLLPKKNTQIQQISLNTQSLIEDLSWINSIQSVNYQPKTHHADQAYSVPSLSSFTHQHLTPQKSSRPKSSSKIYSHNQLETKSQSVNISRALFQKQPNNYLPKTIDLPIKSTYSKPTLNSHIPNINKVYFGNHKKLDLLHEFDDKDTVVNEPQSKPRRKLTNLKAKNQIKKISIQQQNYQKLTKKKLLQKILQLEHSFQKLKNQQQIKQNINYRQNQALLQKFPQQDKQNLKQSLIQDSNIKVNSKVGRKYTFDLDNQKIKNTENPSKNNTLSHIEQKSQQIKSQDQYIQKKGSTLTSQRKISKSRVGDNEKISLSKWVSQVWSDF